MYVCMYGVRSSNQVCFLLGCKVKNRALEGKGAEGQRATKKNMVAREPS